MQYMVSLGLIQMYVCVYVRMCVHTDIRMYAIDRKFSSIEVQSGYVRLWSVTSSAPRLGNLWCATQCTAGVEEFPLFFLQGIVQEILLGFIKESLVDVG